MRWAPFFIVAYLACLVQMSLGRVLVLDMFSVGPFGPDLVAAYAIFIALGTRSLRSALIAAWCLGMLLDLTTGGGVHPATRLGPMSILFTAAVGIIYAIREALFREKAVTQILLGFAFVAFTHGLWMTAQVLLSEGSVGGTLYFRLWCQVLLSGVYTGLLTPLILFLLRYLTPVLLPNMPVEPRSYRRR